MAQVNLPRGFETVEIAVSDEYPMHLSINGCGQILYTKRQSPPPYDPEVYLYDNGVITQLTDNDLPEGETRINDLGDMAWIRYIPDRDIVELVFVREGVETVVDAASSINSVALNNLGHLAWSHYFPGSCNWDLRVMFWDGLNVTQITPEDDYYDQGIGINDFDEIVWTHYDVCRYPWTGTIQAFWDGHIVDLPTITTQDQGPDINNSRHVTWRAGLDSVLWRDGDVLTLVEDYGGAPRINDRDRVSLFIADELTGKPQPWLVKVRNERLRLYFLSDIDRDWNALDINNYGEITCSWINDIGKGDWGGGMLLLRRIRSGDVDSDGRINTHDYRELASCLTGPLQTVGLCACRLLDIDYDGDVDLADYAALQTAFTGD